MFLRIFSLAAFSQLERQPQVPLQYSDLSAGEAQVALLIAPSELSADDPDYRGPLLLNPGAVVPFLLDLSSSHYQVGGPGSSGVDYLLELGTYFREIIGPQYDLVGFDPRGKLTLSTLYRRPVLFLLPRC